MPGGHLQPDAGPVVAPQQQQGARGEPVGNLVQCVALVGLVLLSLLHCCSALLVQLPVTQRLLQHS